jgi:hypothetical protein
MNTFETSLRWDEAAFLEGAKLAYDFQMRHTWRRYAGWLFIAMTQFGVVGVLNHGSAGLLLLSTPLVLYWYVLRWPLRKRMALRSFERSGFAGRSLALEATEEGLCIDGGCVPWRNFGRVVASAEGYLLQRDEGFLFLPRTLFGSAEERNTFVALLKEKISEFHKMES